MRPSGSPTVVSRPSVWVKEIVRLLRTDPRFRFDFVDLQKMPEAIGAQRNPFLNLQVLAHPSGAYVASLAGSWDEFYAAKRSPGTRKRERKQLRQLAEHSKRTAWVLVPVGRS